MEECIEFEKALYGDDPVFLRMDIANYDFWVDRLVNLPFFRPFLLESTANLCKEYCQDPIFRGKILKQSIIKSPVLIYRLFKLNIFRYEEIECCFDGNENYMVYYYFYNMINDFKGFIKQKESPYDVDFSFLDDLSCFPFLIEYGYCPTSIEYVLKYDDIDHLKDYISDIGSFAENEAKWSPFEWSMKPKHRGYLSFSGHFGSVKCFKQLIMCGFLIDDGVIENVIYGGSNDLIHLCIAESNNLYCLAKCASAYCRMSFLSYLINNKIDMEIAINDYYFGQSLHVAIFQGHFSIIEFLLMKGANILALDGYLIIVFFRKLLCILHVKLEIY